MNRSVLSGLFIVMSSAHAFPANPFLPQVSPCEKLTAQLAGWALQGVIRAKQTNTALMLSPQGNWRRIKVESELVPGVQIESVDETGVLAKIDSGCQPATYRWEIKGKTNAMDTSTAAGAATAIHKPGR
ncbi:HofP DNA utilization family protein [Buttiauxella izardii]|nr:HofP DNA utilization family protein [Buttiauxella izardii]